MWYARVQVEALRFRNAVSRYWRRIVVGALCGWLASSVLGAFAVVWLEWVNVITSEQTALLLGAAIVWGGTGLGAIAGYAARPRREAAST